MKLQSLAVLFTNWMEYLGKSYISKKIGQYFLVPSLAVYAVMVNSNYSMAYIGRFLMLLLLIFGALSYTYEFSNEPINQAKRTMHSSRVCTRFLSFVGIWVAYNYLSFVGQVTPSTVSFSVIYLALIIASALPIARLSLNRKMQNFIKNIDSGSDTINKKELLAALFIVFAITWYVVTVLS